MIAMQYSISLPPNYDAALIRQRVEARRALFDEHAGLLHKSFLYNEAQKIYAPFYVWKEAACARDFLLDELFAGVVETFSRHRVRSWYAAQLARGACAEPAYARREIDVIAPEERLSDYLAAEKQAQEALRANPDLAMHLVALDADRWEIMRFSLWKDKQSAGKAAGDSFMDYDVLHVSSPEE